MKKTKNILLVEPDYNSLYPPLGLMKISTWHKRRGNRVDFIGGKILNKKRYDKIYITTLFTYFAKEVIETINFYKNFYPSADIKVGGIFATLMPDYIKKNTGITPHVGLLKAVEGCAPDYTLFPSLKYSLTFTTRGCPRDCKYCAVQIHEPRFFARDKWERDVDITKNRIVFWDNNWFFSPNFLKDIDKLKKINKPFDFNQGLDARLFTAEKAKLLASLKINPLRFAFDSVKEDGHVQRSIQMAQRLGIDDIRVYVLYNFEDSPEEFYYKINEINKLGALSYPMRYRSIDATDRHYIDKNWDKESLRALKLILTFYYSKGMIRKNREAFLKIFGNSPQNVRNKFYDIYKKDKEKSKAANQKTTFDTSDLNWRDVALVNA
jgi:hypothetical protein